MLVNGIEGSMTEPTSTIIGMMTLTDYFYENPILFVLLGLGYVGIIIHHFKLPWKLQNHISDSRVINRLTDSEIIEDYERHLRVQKDMQKEYPNYDYFRKGEFQTKIREEFFKRHLTHSTVDRRTD